MIVKTVKKGRKYYLEDSDRFLHGGYDEVGYIQEGFFVVKIDNKYYYVDEEKCQLHGGENGEGYDYACGFCGGFGIVRKAGKWYYIDKDFKLHGNGYSNIISTEIDGKKQYFSEGFGIVENEGKFYYIDNKDFNLHGKGYKNIWPFSEGFAVVEKFNESKGVQQCFVDKNFKEHGRFDEACSFYEDLAPVKKNGKWYFVDKNFKLHGKGYEAVGHFHEGFAKVKRGGKWYFVDKNFKHHGRLLGYDYAYNFHEGFAVVLTGGKFYFVDNENFKLHGEGYTGVGHFKGGFARVKKNGKWYFVDKNFKLHGEGYDEAGDFENGRAEVKIGNRIYVIDEDFYRIGIESLPPYRTKLLKKEDYLTEVKNDMASIVAIPLDHFSDDGFVNALTKTVKEIYIKKIEGISYKLSEEEKKAIVSEATRTLKLIQSKQEKYQKIQQEKEERKQKLEETRKSQEDAERKRNKEIKQQNENLIKQLDEKVFADNSKSAGTADIKVLKPVEEVEEPKTVKEETVAEVAVEEVKPTEKDSVVVEKKRKIDADKINDVSEVLRNYYQGLLYNKGTPTEEEINKIENYIRKNKKIIESDPVLDFLRNNIRQFLCDLGSDEKHE